MILPLYARERDTRWSKDVSELVTVRNENGEGNDNPLQHSCLENSKDTVVWWATVRAATQKWTQLKGMSTHACKESVAL